MEKLTVVSNPIYSECTVTSKLFIHLVAVTSFILITFILYLTPNVQIAWPQINRKSSFVSSFTFTSSSPTLRLNYSKASSNNARRFALFSSSIHSNLRSYIFYTPITAAAWQRIGYEVIVVFTGDFTDRSNASLSPQLNLSRTFLQRLGVHVLDFQCNISYSIKMSQLVRIFAGFLSDTLVNDTDYILTTDSDIIPMQAKDYQLNKTTDGFIYNAFCCGSFQRRNKTYKMYPMSHLCLQKQLWRNIFLDSIQRKELLASNLPSSTAHLLSNNASFSFDTMSLYTRHEFGQIYDSKMEKGDISWYMDQIYSSMLINDYCDKYTNIKLDKRSKRSSRLDPNLPYQMWEPNRLSTYGDAHLIHDEIFDSYRWVSFRNLLLHLFNASLTNEFDFYYKQFLLTLRDAPEDH